MGLLDHAKSLQSCPTLQPRGPSPAKFLCPWDSPDKNIGVGCHFLLWGIFPTQGSDHISCGSCIASGFFIAKPPGKPSAGTYERFILIFTAVDCIPTNSVQRFPFFTSSPELISCLLDDSHSHRYEMMAHCSIDLQSPDDWWCSYSLSNIQRF